MPASPAQVAANRRNAAHSTGPKTVEGKDASRANALKHGLTATSVIPEREAAEVDRRSVAFLEELKPSGEVGEALARHAARMSVRMERCAEHENAVLVERARRARAEFVPPEGVTDPAEIARLRHAEERRALFDASKEAGLARKYEASAERGFFRALKELRLHERQMKAAEDEEMEQELGSILSEREMVADFDVRYAAFEAEEARTAAATPSGAPSPPSSSRFAPAGGSSDLAFSIGRPR